MRLVLAMMLVSTAAAAEPAASAKQMHADDCAKARKANRTCVLDMTGETVDGNGVTPNGTSTTVIKFPKESSLIHLRTEFIEQIIKTAQDL